MIQWEYHIAYLEEPYTSQKIRAELLNELGKPGWELANVVNDMGHNDSIVSYEFYLKRPKQNNGN